VSLPLVVVNLGSWALQALLLIGVTGAVLVVARVTDPRLRLHTWHGALGVTLLLPFMQRWRTDTASPFFDAAGAAARFPWEPWLVAVVVIGIAARAGWLAAGLRQLRRLRVTATPWRPLPVWYRSLAADAGVSASLAASRDIDGAVTFGVRRPAILVPARLLDAPDPHQRAIVVHELHHVARRDWVWVLAEEALRIALWWHPAIWFALAEARLAREEIVDRRTVAVTGNRADYLEALVAAAEPACAGAPGFGPQFYRRRQLFTRVRRLLEEETMSKSRMLAVAAGLAIAVPVTVLGASAAFPLTAATPAIASQDQPPPPPPPPPPSGETASRRDMPPPPPPPPPKPVKDGDTVVTKDAGKPKPAGPAKETDVTWIKAQPDGPETKKGSKK
jgi:Zn-dependent protease with chaperone function